MTRIDLWTRCGIFGVALFTLVGFIYTARAEDSQKIQGWRAANNCEISLQEGKMIAKCTGDDPQIMCTEPPQANGSIVVTIMAKASVDGGGEIYWSSSEVPEMSEDTRVDLGLQADDKVREYQVTVPVKGDLKGLRFDPGDGVGTVEVVSIQISKEDGTVIKKWTFDAR